MEDKTFQKSEMTLFESIVDVMTTRNHGDMLTAARNLEAIIQREINAKVERDIDELVDDAYLATVAPQPPPPAFAVGTRVRHGLSWGVGTVIDTDEEGRVTVRYDDGHFLGDLTYRTGAILEALDTEPVLPDNVRNLSLDEYKAYRMSKKIAIHEDKNRKAVGFTPPYIIDSLLSKGLIKETKVGNLTYYRAIVTDPAPAAALPEGVTRTEREGTTQYSVSLEGQSSFNYFLWNDKISIRKDNGWQIMDVTTDFEDFKRIIAAGQALIAEMEATHGRD